MGTSISDKARLKLLGRGRNPKKGERELGPLVKRRGSVIGPIRVDRLKWALLISLSLVIAVLLFPSILVKPVKYGLGDVAERDIKASRDFLVENRDLTEKGREKAAREVLSVYDFDPSAMMTAMTALKEAFGLCREYLSKTIEREESPLAPPRISPEPAGGVDLVKKRFFETLRMPPDEKLFKQLMKIGFPAEVEEAVQGVLAGVYEKGVVLNRAVLRTQIEKGGIILHEISTKKETTTTDLNRFFDLERARSHVKGQLTALKESMNAPEQAEAVLKLASFHLAPNLTFNQRETELRKDLARESVKPIYYKIKRGEMLVREGERIGHEHLVKLSEEMKSQNRVDMIGRVPAMAILIGVLLSVIYLVGLGHVRSIKGGRDLLFNAVCLFAFFVFIWAYSFVAEEVARGFPHVTSRSLLFALPLPCAAMLISVFQGMQVAIAFSLIISVLSSLIAGGKVEFFVYFFVGSLVAAYGVRNCNERGILIKTGFGVGFLNIILSLSVGMIFGSLYTWESMVAAISGFAGGMLSGVIATGILPLIEMSFRFTTDIKLLELSNLDQPPLRDLMVQAPGTYHHSVIISNMVEATAKAVQARPLLAKVSAYYHDIGKMKKPLYFIENQMGGENRHEKLAPSMSSLILISHVKDGVELAREHKLGQEIIDIIQQHHGRSLISFFYQKAKDRTAAKGGKVTDVKEEDFRYPGPKPQTKEAGLVMLADMVEAASRSLVDPTPSRIQGMVQKIINNVFSDGQLDECELTLKDLHEIAKSFNKTLSGIFHQRIEYPEVMTKPSKKAKNGSPDQGSAEDTGARKQEDKGETEEGLKRLGLS